MPSRFGGALSGAASGAAIGSQFSPGWGTAAGGILGGIMGLLSPGKKDKNQQLSLQTPEQQQYLQNIFSQLSGQGQAGQNYGQAQNYYGDILGGNPDAYNRFAAPYIQNFEQQILPRLSERFAGLGGGLGGGVGGSSGFGQAIGGAGAGLQAQLANLYAQLQQNAAGQVTGQYNNLAQLGLGQRAFENTYQPGNLGLVGGLAQGVAGGSGQGLGMVLGSRFGNWMNQGNNKNSNITGNQTMKDYQQGMYYDTILNNTGVA